ncbi:hypothetical protein B4P00_21995 [Shewanella xiamenensis]|jgi:hypothetical protein|uniref:hypothetical protein n=1 Tax=Shewanella xiamenensis TaxID=332186 RepID=UPI0008499B1D|nr:hypothetical protein [Shewanella xiamenensis]MBW0298842.1 hypothetical protein [Shewanella xiamenensis]ODR83783.1 hypothetical protein ABT47_23790 [Shewanella xiamenensis]
MTNRTVQIVEIYDDEFSDSYELSGVNCTVREFLDWFFEIEYCEKRYNFIAQVNGLVGGDDLLCDIGGDSRDMKLGGLLSIEFDEFFSAFVQNKINRAKEELEGISHHFRLKHGLDADHNQQPN